MRFFATLESIINTSQPVEKIARFHDFYQNYQQGRILFEEAQMFKDLPHPSYAAICDIVPATTLPKRTSLSTAKGKAWLLHSIMHIEYSAIDLALEHACRFTGMPAEYYDDWLKVADDEIRHFLMLEEILQKLGYRYGSFPVHAFLFDVSHKCRDLLTRMAVVPRYLEASGLDASPLVIDKLRRIDDEASRMMIAALEVILEEEVDHVQKGDRWYRYACAQEGVDPSDYFDIVESVLPSARKPKAYVNVASRKRAGFSCDEIAVISSQP
ncbi:MAG TPA: ferritin-like domain-containing protein, partial [Campylobacteraceae bacterium]|nr:ferritin-like domain-containing protein [Campylobacteraceae bacterium]